MLSKASSRWHGSRLIHQMIAKIWAILMDIIYKRVQIKKSQLQSLISVLGRRFSFIQPLQTIFSSLKIKKNLREAGHSAVLDGFGVGI